MPPAPHVVLVINAAFLIASCGFLARDVLHLRLLAMVAYSGLLYGVAVRPAWPGAPHYWWYLAFVVINAGHAGWLLWERSQTHLSPDEEEVYTRAFPSLDRLWVRRLMRRAEWRAVAPGDVLAREGQAPERLALIARGAADVTLGGRAVTRLREGQFVGEVAFLTGDPATATVIAARPSRVLFWPRDALREWLAGEPQLHAVLYAALGNDLAEKIAATTLRVAREDG
jgi:hypothetical protein